MKKNNIDVLVKKILTETLEDKADELTNKIKSKTSDMDEELIGGQTNLDKNKNGRLDKEDFKMLRRGKKSVEENQECDECGNMYEEDEEMEEGNEFTGELEKARKEHKKEFSVGGKKYPVKESLTLSEEEMISLIESIVIEQKKVKGMAETEKVLSADKKENDQYIKDVTKKMKDYLKNMSKGEFTTEPKTFPQGNGQMKKDDTMAYHPSDAVDEYIDAFAFPGQTNLVFDEIKPDEKKIEKYLKGDSTTGNAQVDKDGKALGNVVPSKVGEKFHKNYKDNFYGQEQMKSSYKRYPQDTIEVAGETTKKGGLNYGKKSAQKILDKVDESINKEEKVLTEEFGKMKHLINYDKKTQ